MDIVKRKYALLMTLLASSTGLLHADQNWNASDGQSDYCCPPSVCCEESPSRFFFGAEVLCWKPYISGLELGFGTSSITQTTGDGLQTTTTDEYDVDPSFKWNAGYRLAAGYQFDCSAWGVGARWTHFQGKGTRSSDGTLNTGSCHLKFSQLDLILAYNTPETSSFSFKPFIGVRGARINESLDATIIADISLPLGATATETRTFDDSQSYRGIGPIFGLAGDWEIGNGFAVYANAAASFLYGTYKIHFDDPDIFSAPISAQVFSTGSKHVHGYDWNIDLALGIRWETCLCDCYQVSLQLGVEHHQYFDHSRLGSDRGDLTLDGGTFGIGLAF